MATENFNKCVVYESQLIDALNEIEHKIDFSERMIEKYGSCKSIVSDNYHEITGALRAIAMIRMSDELGQRADMLSARNSEVYLNHMITPGA